MRRVFPFVFALAASLVSANEADAGAPTTPIANRFAITVDGQFAGWAQKAEGMDVAWDMPDYRAGDAGNSRWFFPANTKLKSIKLTFADGLVPFDWTLIKAAIAGNATAHTVALALYDSNGHLLMQWTLSNSIMGSVAFSPINKEKTQNANVVMTFYSDGFVNGTSAPATSTWPVATGDSQPTGFAFDFTNCGTACNAASQLTFTAKPQITLPASDPVRSAAARGTLAENGALTILSKSGAHLLDLHYQGVGMDNAKQVAAAQTNAPSNVTFVPKITKVL